MRFCEVSSRPKRFVHFYPATVVVIGVYAPGGRANFMPAVWHGGLSFDPPLFGVSVSPKRYTHGLLKEAEAFSVSMHPFKQAEQIQKIGTVSGREVDKVAALGLEVVRGRALEVPILAGAYAAYELEKTDRITTGDHDLFIGRLRGLWEDEAAFAENAINPGLAPSLLYYGRYRYGRPEPEVLDLEGR
ncbi:flavin reductase family protein [Oceanithermus sp.]